MIQQPEFNLIRPERGRTVAPPLLQAERLSKTFLGRRIVHSVDLSVSAGEIVGLVGPNGAGKTTVFRMVAGTLVAGEGKVLFEGRDITRLPLQQRVRDCRISYLAQVPSIFGKVSTLDNLTGFLRLMGYDAKTSARRAFAGLEEFELAEQADLPAAQLSGGQKRRLEIARSLLIEPRLMLMDEPFTGIDPIATDRMRLMIESIRDRGIGVLITEHRVVETLSVVDRCYVIHGGRVLVEGKPSEVVRHTEARRAYFGTNFDEALIAKRTPPKSRAA